MLTVRRFLVKLIVVVALFASLAESVAARDATPASGLVPPADHVIVEPSPTPDEPLSAADVSEYADLLLLFSGPEVNPQTFAGLICVQVSVNPPLPSGSWVGTMCESSTPETTVWHSDEYTSLPVSSVYSLSISSNTSDCTAIPVSGVVEEIDGDNVYGRMEVRIECPALPPVPPVETFSLLQLYLQDVRGGGGSFYYPGDLCVDVHSDPPLPGGPLVGSGCYDVSPSGASWFPPDFPDLPVANTYTASIVSNATGCIAEIAPQIHGDVRESVTVPEGDHHGMILIYIDCLGAAETPEPTVTFESTTIPDPTEEPRSTETSVSTSRPIWTVVPDPSGGATGTVPSADPSPTSTMTVIGLPNTGNTGTGSSGMGNSLTLLFAAFLFIVLGVGAIRHKRQRIR